MKKTIYLSWLFFDEVRELRITLPELIGYEDEIDNSWGLNGYDGHGYLDIISEEISKDEDGKIIYKFTKEKWVDAISRIVTLNKDGSVKVYVRTFAINEYSDQDDEEFIFILDPNGGINSIEVWENDKRIDRYEDKYEAKEYFRFHIAKHIIRITRIIDIIIKDIRKIEKRLKKSK